MAQHAKRIVVVFNKVGFLWFFLLFFLARRVIVRFLLLIHCCYLFLFASFALTRVLYFWWFNYFGCILFTRWLNILLTPLRFACLYLLLVRPFSYILRLLSSVFLWYSICYLKNYFWSFLRNMLWAFILGLKVDPP